MNNRINVLLSVKHSNVTLKHGNTLRSHLWNTGGEERFKAITPLYYHDANAAILRYDVTDMKTFKNLEDWVK